jgi:hypothetical protein
LCPTDFGCPPDEDFRNEETLMVCCSYCYSDFLQKCSVVSICVILVCLICSQRCSLMKNLNRLQQRHFFFESSSAHGEGCLLSLPRLSSIVEGFGRGTFREGRRLMLGRGKMDWLWIRVVDCPHNGCNRNALESGLRFRLRGPPQSALQLATPPSQRPASKPPEPSPAAADSHLQDRVFIRVHFGYIHYAGNPPRVSKASGKCWHLNMFPTFVEQILSSYDERQKCLSVFIKGILSNIH